MGDTIKQKLDDDWTEIEPLILGKKYSFQNVNSEDLFLQQVPLKPDAKETGFRLEPSKRARITKETSPVWARSIPKVGLAYYNELP